MDFFFLFLPCSRLFSLYAILISLGIPTLVHFFPSPGFPSLFLFLLILSHLLPLDFFPATLISLLSSVNSWYSVITLILSSLSHHISYLPLFSSIFSFLPATLTFFPSAPASNISFSFFHFLYYSCFTILFHFVLFFL